jgi:hypothetical protein
MRWKFPRRKLPGVEKRVPDLPALMSSEAMMNRCALNPETLRLYAHIVDVGASGSPEGLREAGRLSYELVSVLAKERGRTPPQSVEETVSFLLQELKGFDAPEARERGARARLNEIFEIMRVDRKACGPVLQGTDGERSLCSVGAMQQAKILRVTPISQPIDGDLHVDIELSCVSCDRSGVVQLTDVQWAAVRGDVLRYECAECGGPTIS